jgi:serine phosphatase RsbU (regulator of sigma subunit)
VKNPVSPKSSTAWRCVWLNALMIGLVAVFSSLQLGGANQTSQVIRILTTAFLLVGWLNAVRFLMLDTWGRIFWFLGLAGALILTQIWGNAGLVLAILMSVIFMITRMFNPWRLVSARKRAVGFGLGIMSLVVLFGSTGVWSTEVDDQVLTGLDKLGIWSLGSLMVFWFLSLFHLAIRMRLHFLRLRAKLAVSAFLIGFVPLVLVVVLGSMVFYAGLGGSRTLRATNILESWRTMAAQGNDLVGVPFDTTFVWPDSPASESESPPGRIPAPVWVPKVSGFLGTGRDLPAQADTTTWFMAEQSIWLIRWHNVGQEDTRAQGWLLNEAPLVYLSGLLKVGIELTEIGLFMSNSSINIGSDDSPEGAKYVGQKACYRDTGGDPTFWNPWRSFGVSFFPVIQLEPEGLDEGQLLLNLGVGWADLKTEFLEGENNLNIVWVIMLAVVAFLFLTIEMFAFFFGVRISEGFVTAVHSLHKGTRALTNGDLDTVIDIPNEDEFGDLADSFNEMTVSIRQGRKDALAKEALTRELATAREIQERLLPSDEPALTGFEITGASIPSREVGGDYFDFLIRDKDNIGVAIGDVSGKGMPAALLMSNLQASLHGQVIHPSSVAQVVGLVNNLIVASTDSHMFATFFYGLLDTAAGTFTSTNAGHNPPLVLRADGTLETLNAGGLLLGMLADQQYKQETVSLAPGDVVVLYTDGITEAVGPGTDEDDVDAMFGEEALEDVIRRSSHLPAVGIKEAILDGVARHTEGMAQSDDITLVVIRRQG